jgi:hypothetical protein
MLAIVDHKPKNRAMLLKSWLVIEMRKVTRNARC